MQYSDFPNIGLQSYESPQIGSQSTPWCNFRDFIPTFVTTKLEIPDVDLKYLMLPLSKYLMMARGAYDEILRYFAT